MNWFKLAGSFHTHPKLKRLQSQFPRRWRRAVTLWTMAASWCAQHEKDGVIELAMLPMFMSEPGDADMLVAVGFWESRHDDSFQFHDWFDFQLTANQLRTSRERAIERAQKSRKSRIVAPHDALPDLIRSDLISSEEREERLKACVSSSGARARFEKPPVGDAPPNTRPSEPARDPWIVVWNEYEKHVGREGMLGHPGRFRDALQDIAGAAAVEAGVSAGVPFVNAVQRLLGAWSSDKWVVENKPTIRNLATRLEKYTKPSKSVAKVAPAKSGGDRLVDWYAQIERSKSPEQRRQEMRELGLIVPDDVEVAS